jgi:hemerythrin-like metal-binding protein
MPFLTWNDRLSVNIAEIDGQHKKLVAMLNKLFEAMTEGQADEAMIDLVGEMKLYAVSHFALEERLMKQHDFPGLADHKAEHAVFVDKASEVDRYCRQGQFSMSQDVLTFLSKWLLNHILDTDRKYGPFLNKCGVK